MELIGQTSEGGAPEQNAIYLLNGEQFDHYWPQIEECLNKTDFGHYHTKEWLREAVKVGHVHVWILSDGMIRVIVFSEMIQYPIGLTIRIFWGYGAGLDQFLENANDMMDLVAGVMKAKRIEIVGRKGWMRKMRRFGFETETYIIGRAVREKRSN